MCEHDREVAMSAQSGESIDPNFIFGAVMRRWRENDRKIGLRRAADELSMNFSHLAKWERGERPVPSDMIHKLDHVYAADGLLIALHNLMARHDALLAISDSGYLSSGTFEGNLPHREDDDTMERRALLQLLTALGYGSAIPMSALETIFSHAESVIGGHENTNLEEWEESVFEYGFLYVTRPPGSLISSATTDFVEISRLLTISQTPVMRSGLLRISAQLAALLGMEFSDIGEKNASLRSWRLARRAADATEDRELRVWVRVREASYAFWTGRPGSITSRLIDDAVQIGDRTPSASLARALSVKATVSASGGDTEATRTALTDLQRAYERIPDRRRESPLWSFSERRMHWGQAYPSALIGDTTEATKAVERSLALCPADYRADIAELKLIQALSLAHDRDVTTSLDIATAATEGQPLGASRRRILGQIVDALPEKARALPAARDLHVLAASGQSA
ncbi:helix-turn-helix domain-containing protein [Streptosporangium carneum]|nr:helix-turn-helix transcriptional regulator [Streptosporangium carneum]